MCRSVDEVIEERVPPLEGWDETSALENEAARNAVWSMWVLTCPIIPRMRIQATFASKVLH
eukprot:395076-Amphidinium_carterae.1